NQPRWISISRVMAAPLHRIPIYRITMCRVDVEWRMHSGSPRDTAPDVDQHEVMRAAEFRRLLRRFTAHGDTAVRRAGLTPQRYLLLLAIKGAADGSQSRSIGQLTDDLQLAQSSVTEQVDRAEAAGLVVRAGAETDGRTVLV